MSPIPNQHSTYFDIYDMARTKQTARRSTGGKSVPKPLAAKAARKKPAAKATNQPDGENRPKKRKKPGSTFSQPLLPLQD